jgi:hypothetical protein
MLKIATKDAQKYLIGVAKRGGNTISITCADMREVEGRWEQTFRRTWIGKAL